MRAASEHVPEWRQRRLEAPKLSAELMKLPDTEAHRKIKASRGKLHSAPLVDMLVCEAARITPKNPAEGLRVSGLALALLDRIPQRVREEFVPKIWLDLHGAAWAEQGNALRVLRQWKPSRRSFGRAVVFLEGGTGDAARGARVASLLGSLYWDRRKIRAASRALKHAAKAYAELGDERRLGKVQLQQAALLDGQGFLGEAVQLQLKAVGRLDEFSDPADFLTAHVNLASMMERQERAQEALYVLEASRHLVVDAPETRNVAGWYWVSGRCHLTAGSSAKDAEVDLLHSWRIMGELERWSDYGLVGLDLSKLYLRCGRFEDLKQISKPTVEALSRQRLTPDAVRMLGDYRQAVALVVANAEGLREVISGLVEELTRKETRR